MTQGKRENGRLVAMTSPHCSKPGTPDTWVRVDVRGRGADGGGDTHQENAL